MSDEQEEEYLAQEGPPARMAPSSKELEIRKLAGELVELITMRTIKSEVIYQDTLGDKARELKKALEG